MAHIIPAQWMVSSEFIKRLLPKYYAHDCRYTFLFGNLSGKESIFTHNSKNVLSPGILRMHDLHQELW